VGISVDVDLPCSQNELCPVQKIFTKLSPVQKNAMNVIARICTKNRNMLPQRKIFGHCR
jgi:hypothetical protein